MLKIVTCKSGDHNKVRILFGGTMHRFFFLLEMYSFRREIAFVGSENVKNIQKNKLCYCLGGGWVGI